MPGQRALGEISIISRWRLRAPIPHPRRDAAQSTAMRGRILMIGENLFASVSADSEMNGFVFRFSVRLDADIQGDERSAVSFTVVTAVGFTRYWGFDVYFAYLYGE